VLDVEYPEMSVNKAILKVLPPLAKLCVPDKSSDLNASGIILAIYRLLLFHFRLW
jgi:hypothetical protein